MISDEEFCARLENILGVNIRRTELYRAAFTHSSYVGDSQQESQYPSYERLEFLGDSVLGFVVAGLVFKNYDDMNEGSLTKLKSMVVSEPVISEIALELGLQELLILGKGEEMSSGREKPSIRADSFEALIGALYIDRSISAARKFVTRLLLPRIQEAVRGNAARNFKSRLQEELQSRFKTPPHYQLVKAQGPDHDRTFTVAVRFQKRLLGQGLGSSKKEAEQNAARNTLEHWSEFFPNDKNPVRIAENDNDIVPAAALPQIEQPDDSTELDNLDNKEKNVPEGDECE